PPALLVGVLVLDQSRLVVAPAQAPPRHELDAGLDDEHAAEPFADRLRKRGISRFTLRKLDADGERRLLLDALRARLHNDVAADGGDERTHDFADRRREDVHTAHD